VRHPQNTAGRVRTKFGAWRTSRSSCTDRLTEFDLGETWVATSLGLVVLGAVLGSLGGRRPKRARLLAERQAAVDREVRRLLDDPLSLWLNAAAAAAYVAVLALMVWKPG
jgi:uncharacterized membrane protein